MSFVAKNGLCVLIACCAFVAISTENAKQGVIRNYGLWPDNNGIHINAHGGCVISHAGRYWWYGEHKVHGEAGNRAHGTAVHVYSSSDLINWRDEGAALTCAADEWSDICDDCIVERPKVLFCQKTGKFVMHFHLELKCWKPYYHASRTGIAVSDVPQGPFRYLYGLRPNAGLWPQDANPAQCNDAEIAAARSRKHTSGRGPEKRLMTVNLLAEGYDAGQATQDLTMFVDDDGVAYQISASEGNSTLQIAELTDDYLGFTGRYWRMAEKDWTEAPAVCHYGGWYYLIGSGCTGWKPNAARLYRARKVTGPWERMDNPCRGTNTLNGLTADVTWGCQSAYILKVAGGHIAMFDVWNPQDASDGRYVWLPIDFSNETPVIHWRSEWQLEFVKDERANKMTCIHGMISDCKQYEMVHPGLRKAFEFLRKHDLATLAIGRYEIEKDNCWAMVQLCELMPFKDVQRTEVHDEFIDIQVPIDGPETYGVADSHGLLYQPFDEEKDVGFVETKTRPLTVFPGEFVIFFPATDGHAPCRTLGPKTMRKKLVIKIRK